MTRLRANGVAGQLSTVGGINTTATAFDSAGLADMPAVASPNTMAVTFFTRDTAGRVTAMEIVTVTAHTASATTATITRGQEGTTAASWAVGANWVAGATAKDFTGQTRDARYVARPGQTVIDEFNDESLNSSWTRVDNGADSAWVVWSEGADTLSASHAGGDASSELHALMIPLTNFGGSVGVNDAFSTYLTLAPLDNTNYFVGGVILADGVTYGSGNQIAAFNYTGGMNFDSRSFTGYNTQTGAAGTYSSVLVQGTHLRLVQTASGVWRTDISQDGVTWRKAVATLAKTITPTHVGLYLTTTNSTQKGIAYFDYLRRDAGVT